MVTTIHVVIKSRGWPVSCWLAHSANNKVAGSIPDSIPSGPL